MNDWNVGELRSLWMNEWWMIQYLYNMKIVFKLFFALLYIDVVNLNHEYEIDILTCIIIKMNN